MTKPRRDSRAQGFVKPELTIDLQQRAIAVLEGHPHCQAARSHIYCEPTAMLEPISILDRTRWDDQTKQQIRQQLKGSGKLLIVMFITADEVPQPFRGAGTSYDFVLHPDSLAILHTSTSSWRA